MKIDYAIFSFYSILILLQGLEFFVPWAKYCTFNMYPFNALSNDLGLSLDDRSRKAFSTFESDLCGPFKKIIENACASFCGSLNNFGNAGLYVTVGNFICLGLYTLYAANFYLRAKGMLHLRIPRVIAWVNVYVKIISGIIYMEILQPYTIPTTWMPEHDFQFGKGIYLFNFDIFFAIVVAYFVYNLPDDETERIKFENIY